MLAVCACGGEAKDADPSPAKQAAPAPAKPQPAPELAKEPEVVRPPAPPSEARRPVVDLLTVSTLEARIVAVHDEFWTACGRAHSVGAVEVEVLDAGDPPPHMFLYVSCPLGIGKRELLVPDVRVSVELFARKQSWPKPRVDVGELPVRYVRRVTASATPVEPGQ